VVLRRSREEMRRSREEMRHSREEMRRSTWGLPQLNIARKRSKRHQNAFDPFAHFTQLLDSYSCKDTLNAEQYLAFDFAGL